MAKKTITFFLSLVFSFTTFSGQFDLNIAQENQLRDSLSQFLEHEKKDEVDQERFLKVITSQLAITNRNLFYLFNDPESMFYKDIIEIKLIDNFDQLNFDYNFLDIKLGSVIINEIHNSIGKNIYNNIYKINLENKTKIKEALKEKSKLAYAFISALTFWDYLFGVIINEILDSSLWAKALEEKTYFNSVLAFNSLKGFFLVNNSITKFLHRSLFEKTFNDYYLTSQFDILNNIKNNLEKYDLNIIDQIIDKIDISSLESNFIKIYYFFSMAGVKLNSYEDALLIYYQFLRLFVDSWLKHNYKIKEEFIKNLLGDKLYTSLGEFIEISSIDFDGFINFSLINALSLNENIKKNIIAHMKKYPKKFLSFCEKNLLFLGADDDEKIKMREDFISDLKSDGFDINILGSINNRQDKKNVQKNKNIKKKKKNRQKNIPNKKTLNNKIESIIKDNVELKIFNDLEIKKIRELPQNQTGFSKINLNKKIKTKQKKYFKINVSASTKTIKINSKNNFKNDILEKIDNYANLLDRANALNFKNLISSLNDFREIFFTILNKQEITHEEIKYMIKKYHSALKLHCEVYNLDEENLLKNINLNSFHIDREVDLPKLLDDGVFSIEMMGPSQNLSLELLQYYEYKNGSKNDFAQLEEIDEFIKNISKDKNISIDKLLAHRQYYDEIVFANWKQQKDNALYILAILGHLKITNDNPMDKEIVINEQIIFLWENFFKLCMSFNLCHWQQISWQRHKEKK